MISGDPGFSIMIAATSDRKQNRKLPLERRYEHRQTRTCMQQPAKEGSDSTIVSSARHHKVLHSELNLRK